MIKKCVVLNEKVINVGDWDYQIVDDGITNPLPEGAVIEEREFEYTEKHGWRQVGIDIPLSEIEQLKKQQADLMFELLMKGVL